MPQFELMIINTSAVTKAKQSKCAELAAVSQLKNANLPDGFFEQRVQQQNYLSITDEKAI